MIAKILGYLKGRLTEASTYVGVVIALVAGLGFEGSEDAYSTIAKGIALLASGILMLKKEGKPIFKG